VLPNSQRIIWTLSHLKLPPAKIIILFLAGPKPGKRRDLSTSHCFSHCSRRPRNYPDFASFGFQDDSKSRKKNLAAKNCAISWSTFTRFCRNKSDLSETSGLDWMRTLGLMDYVAVTVEEVLKFELGTKRIMNLVTLNVKFCYDKCNLSTTSTLDWMSALVLKDWVAAWARSPY
jgi:hypothetical protein